MNRRDRREIIRGVVATTAAAVLPAVPDAPAVSVPVAAKPAYVPLPPYCGVEMLTPSELQSLKRKAKEVSAYFQKAFAHLRPKAKEDKDDA